MVAKGMWTLVGMTEGWLNNLPFRLQASLPKTTTCNTSIFWVWAITNQWLWTLSVLTGLPTCLVLWHSLNWINAWGRGNDFRIDFWGGFTQK